MKKKVSTKSKHNQHHHSGVALLISFVMAIAALALAFRQFQLEKRLQYRLQEEVSQGVNKLSGKYQVVIPLAKDERTITLELKSDRQAILTSTLASSQEPEESIGNWSGDTNGTVVVTVATKTYAFTYLPSGNGALRILNPDVTFWGASTVTLLNIANN